MKTPVAVEIGDTKMVPSREIVAPTRSVSGGFSSTSTRGEFSHSLSLGMTVRLFCSFIRTIVVPTGPGAMMRERKAGSSCHRPTEIVIPP